MKAGKQIRILRVAIGVVGLTLMAFGTYFSYSRGEAIGILLIIFGASVAVPSIGVSLYNLFAAMAITVAFRFVSWRIYGESESTTFIEYLYVEQILTISIFSIALAVFLYLEFSRELKWKKVVRKYCDESPSESRNHVDDYEYGVATINDQAYMSGVYANRSGIHLDRRGKDIVCISWRRIHGIGNRIQDSRQYAELLLVDDDGERDVLTIPWSEKLDSMAPKNGVPSASQK